jgi:CelD/BcsL family acetyltransferase involved in cellulose biosynthesis
VAIAGDWAAYERGLSANVRKDVRRRRRRLEELGEVAVEVADGQERLEELLDEGFRVEAAGWKGEEGSAILSDERTRRFYTDVARWAAGRGWLRLSFLRLDGRAVAFEYSLEQGGVFSCVKGGYDGAYARFSPGRVISHALLERAFARGLTRFDLLGADEAYKRAWTGTTRDLQLLQAFAPSLPGAAQWAAASYGRPAVERARQVLRRAARAR